jgi:hypothetical protein
MLVCTMARARAFMVGPDFSARTAARACPSHLSTTLSSGLGP